MQQGLLAFLRRYSNAQLKESRCRVPLDLTFTMTEQQDKAVFSNTLYPMGALAATPTATASLRLVDLASKSASLQA
jgi:hypothetical protein